VGPKERSMKPIGILGETVLEPKDNQERVFPGSANVATRRNAGENQLRPRDTLEERVSTCTFSAGSILTGALTGTLEAKARKFGEA